MRLMIPPQPILGALLVVSAFGCDAENARASLVELGARDDVHVEPSAARDVCRCACGKLACWNVTCSGTGCSESDEYTLKLIRGPQSDASECGSEMPDVRARVLVEGASVAPIESRVGCGSLEFTWRGLPETLGGGLEHRVVMEDSSTAWTIVDPFREVSAIPLAPASLVGQEEGAIATVAAGETIVVRIEPALRVRSANAALSNRTVRETPRELPVAIREATLELSVPSPTASEIRTYDLSLVVATELDRDACHGPPACHGRGLAATWSIRIE